MSILEQNRDLKSSTKWHEYHNVKCFTTQSQLFGELHEYLLPNHWQMRILDFLREGLECVTFTKCKTSYFQSLRGCLGAEKPRKKAGNCTKARVVTTLRSLFTLLLL